MVLATNIAETSLTIEGIRLVADSVLERVTEFDARSGLSRLLTQRISQASMAQRAGRAGRLARASAGTCSAGRRPNGRRSTAAGDPAQRPERVFLELLLWGCRDAGELRWLDEPPETIMAAARGVLQQLGATDDAGRLTAVGRGMAQIGCDPRLAAMLCHAEGHDDSLATAALLRRLLKNRPAAVHRICAITWPVRNLIGCGAPNSWPGDCRRAGAHRTAGEGKRCWPGGSAIVSPGAGDASGRYLLANGLGAALAPDDALSAAEWLIAPGLLQMSHNPDAAIRLAMPLDIADLIARFPRWVTVATAMHWDREKGGLRVVRREQLGSLVLLEQPQARPSAELMQQALLNWIGEQGAGRCSTGMNRRSSFGNACCAPVSGCRKRTGRRWTMPHCWPPCRRGCSLRWPACMMFRALRQVNIGDALLRLLDWPMRQRLESALPSHYTVPTGSRLPVRYRHGEPPVLAVRMQEIFGEQRTPMLAEGRVGLVLELLSPAAAPVAITGDLAAFWQGAYREVQKEMKGRYPKHVWPDDPGPGGTDPAYQKISVTVMSVSEVSPTADAGGGTE